VLNFVANETAVCWLWLWLDVGEAFFSHICRPLSDAMEVAAALSTMLPTGRHAVAQQLLAAHQPAAPQRGDGRPRGTVPLLEFLEAQQQAGQQSGPARLPNPAELRR